MAQADNEPHIQVLADGTRVCSICGDRAHPTESASDHLGAAHRRLDKAKRIIDFALKALEPRQDPMVSEAVLEIRAFRDELFRGD